MATSGSVDSALLAGGDRGGDLPLVGGDVCQIRRAGGVTDSQDVVVSRPKLVVDLDEAVLGAFDTGRIEAQPLVRRVRLPAGGDNDVVA
mgnify:CR=1 FL=1